jgi:hypothetical protein
MKSIMTNVDLVTDCIVAFLVFCSVVQCVWTLISEDTGRSFWADVFWKSKTGNAKAAWEHYSQV